MPPSIEGDRNDYALEAAQKHPGRFAVMGRFPLHSGRDKNLLAGWRAQPGMLLEGCDLVAAPDCGLNHLPRDVAFAKLQALAAGAALVRGEAAPSAAGALA